MDTSELKEYSEKEQEIANNLFTENTIRLEKNESSTLGHLDFYPEISDILKNKTYTNWMINPDSIFIQLPFYDKILLPIRPFPTPEIYEKGYGITVEQTVELTKKGKVIPLPAHDPMSYRNLDYLDMLLELRNPAITHRMARYNTCRLVTVMKKPFEQLIDWVHEGESIALRMDLTGANNLAKLTNKTLGKYAKIKNIESSIGTDYAHLHLMGYSRLAEDLIDFDDSATVYASLLMFSNALHRIPSWALDGTQSMLQRDYALAEAAGAKLEKPFPVDVGKLLTKEFSLINIRDVGFEKVIDITKNTEKARKALLELDKAVEKEQTDKMVDRAIALENVWMESNETIKSMMQRRKTLAKYIPLFFGLIGPATSFLNTPGIIETITNAVDKFDIASSISDRLRKLRKPNHIVALYSLKKSQEIH